MIPMQPDPMPEGSTLVKFADKQPQYHTLPAAYVPNERIIVTEWEPSAEELDRLFRGGRVKVTVLLCGQHLQPFRVEA